MKKSLLLMGCSAVLGVSLLTGCGSKEEEPEYQIESAQTENNSSGEQQGNMKMVKVTEIDGSTITADVAEMGGGPQGSMEPPQGSMDPGQGGEKPEGDNAPQGSMEPPQGSMPPAQNGDGKQPEGSMEPPTQDGDNSDGKGDGGRGGMGEFSSSGESITFEVTDDTVITKGNGDDAATVTLEDISEDSILMVELDDNNQATKIMISEQDSEQASK